MSLDVSLAEHANRLAGHHDNWEDVAGVYAAISEPLFAIGVVALIVVGLALRRRALVLAGALSVVAAGLALAVAHIVSVLVDRPRPFVAHPQIHAFLSHAADASFPSDHATAAFAIAGVLAIRLGRAAWPVLAAALVLAVARVLLGLHYPTDVLAGALLGLGAAGCVCAVARRLDRQRHHEGGSAVAVGDGDVAARGARQPA
jgi:undecaprenyl-diphosphatase